jgi:hypothetical protein
MQTLDVSQTQLAAQAPAMVQENVNVLKVSSGIAALLLVRHVNQLKTV